MWQLLQDWTPPALNVQTGTELRLQGDLGRRYRSVAFGPTGIIMIAGTDDGVLVRWDMGTLRVVVTRAAHFDTIDSIHVSPSAKLVVTASRDGRITIRDVLTLTGQNQQSGHRHSVEWVRFSPDGKVIATGSRDRTLRCWTLQLAKSLQVRSPSRSDFRSIVSPR